MNEPAQKQGHRLKRTDFDGVRDACNAFLITFLWNCKHEEINVAAALSNLRQLKAEINEVGKLVQGRAN